MSCKERLIIEYDGYFVPKKCCTVNQYGEADDCTSCEEVCEERVKNAFSSDSCNGCPIQECFNKLAGFEDKLENGTLLELPCKVGDNYYIVQSKCTQRGYYEYKKDCTLSDCEHCCWENENKCDKEYYIKEKVFNDTKSIFEYYWDYLNPKKSQDVQRFRRIYHIYEEAEQKLKELKEK